MFELPEIDVEAAREAIAQCVRASGFATDTFLIDNATRLRGCTGAQRSALTVQAALSYLFGSGLIVMAPEWPEYLALETPTELKADLDAALSRSVSNG